MCLVSGSRFDMFRLYMLLSTQIRSRLPRKQVGRHVMLQTFSSLPALDFRIRTESSLGLGECITTFHCFRLFQIVSECSRTFGFFGWTISSLDILVKSCFCFQTTWSYDVCGSMIHKIARIKKSFFNETVTAWFWIYVFEERQHRCKPPASSESQ